MTHKQKKQFNEYLIREVARRIVSMSLEASGDVDCIAQAKKLRGLPDDANMGVVARECETAFDAAYSVCHVGSAYIAAERGTVCAAAAYSSGIVDIAGALVYDANCVDISVVYADILQEAAKRLPSDVVPIIPDLHRKMYDAVTHPDNFLEMKVWHTCETTHCRAGWAIVLGGEVGEELEEAFGPGVAGGLIYACNTGMVPDFHKRDNKSVMADMKLLAQAS